MIIQERKVSDYVWLNPSLSELDELAETAWKSLRYVINAASGDFAVANGWHEVHYRMERFAGIGGSSLVHVMIEVNEDSGDFETRAHMVHERGSVKGNKETEQWLEGIMSNQGLKVFRYLKLRRKKLGLRTSFLRDFR